MPSRSKKNGIRFGMRPSAWVLGTLFTGGDTEEHRRAVTDSVLRGSRFWLVVSTPPPAACALRTVYLHNLCLFQTRNQIQRGSGTSWRTHSLWGNSGHTAEFSLTTHGKETVGPKLNTSRYPSCSFQSPGEAHVTSPGLSLGPRGY